jgi:hypothetical protein
MRPTYQWLVAASAVMLSACAPGSEASAPSVRCQVTSAPVPAFVPPPPYPAQPPPAYANEFWYGTADLWTMLRSDETWMGLPQSPAGASQKVFWWSAQYGLADEPVPAITVTGHRLDGPSDPLISSPATNASADFGTARLTGVTLPATGCWEITGHYRGHDLTFVIQVIP